MRSIWERYYVDANCVIFVVDSVDIGRMEEAKLAYESICNDSRLMNRPVFTFANKQDLKGALTANDIARRFHLVQDKAEIARVFSVSAVTENGIKDALTTVMNEAKNGSMIE